MTKHPKRGKKPGDSVDVPHVDKKLARRFGWDGTERRQHPRLAVQWNGVLEHLSPESLDSAEVRLSDVSEGGCCIFLRNPPGGPDQRAMLVVEGPLTLRMFVPGAVLSAQVEIRWYMPIDNDAYAAGLQFLQMSARDRALLLAALQNLGRSGDARGRGSR